MREMLYFLRTRRQALLRRLELPEHLSANGMLEALNLLYDRETLEQAMQEEA